jgi:imidazolonepropionase-like amidohydrolase
MLAELQRVVGQMNRAGVTLMAGTDIAGARVPGFTLHDELALLVDSGLTPLQALQAATVTPSRVWGREAGAASIEPGAPADLVLLDANPLVDIAHTRRIAAVILGGRCLERSDLGRLLNQAERMAAAN